MSANATIAIVEGQTVAIPLRFTGKRTQCVFCLFLFDFDARASRGSIETNTNFRLFLDAFCSSISKVCEAYPLHLYTVCWRIDYRAYKPSNLQDRASQMLTDWNETLVCSIVQIYTRNRGSPLQHCGLPESLWP